MDLMQGTGREIATGEAVEKELDAFLSRRHERRATAEGGRPEEEAWVASERAHSARRRAEMRTEWREYHTRQAEAHRRNLGALVAFHEAAAEGLTEGGAA